MFKSFLFQPKSAPRTNHKALIVISLCRPAPEPAKCCFALPATNASSRCPLANSTQNVRFSLGFNHDTFNDEGIFSGHVKISGSLSVISTVCSK